MERMTFYIPPVFLFGNKVRHNQEEKKTEYKTAAETEIKVENWRVKRIAELEEENRNLKEDNERLAKGNYDELQRLGLENYELREENKKLKDKFMLRLAEAYLLPSTSNQMAEYKQWNYSKWYDEIKNQMRKEIKEED